MPRMRVGKRGKTINPLKIVEFFMGNKGYVLQVEY